MLRMTRRKQNRVGRQKMLNGHIRSRTEHCKKKLHRDVYSNYCKYIYVYLCYFLLLLLKYYQQENGGNQVDAMRREAGGEQDEVEDHSSDNGSHQRGAEQKGVSVFEGGGGVEVEDEVVVDPCALPHEQVASVHEHVQAQ